VDVISQQDTERLEQNSLKIEDLSSVCRSQLYQ
jgi:hypothetical protein